MSQVNMRKALDCFREYRRVQLKLVAERMISEDTAGDNCMVFLAGVCAALDLDRQDVLREVRLILDL